MSPITVRKALISSFGSISNINVVSASLPDPPVDYVQVRVIYSGFSGADVAMRHGTYPLQKKPPLTPGYSLVGTVSSNGKRSSKFHPGDVVACLFVYDAEAELANFPEKYLVKVPSGLDLEQVTALVLDWNTAYGLVHHAGKLAKGRRVFVHGMSGAVGYGVMILSQLQGATVYGTASERNHLALRELGVTPFTYTNKDWIIAMKDPGRARVVFDPLGFESWDESWSILEDKGRLVGYGGNLNILSGKPPRSVVGPILKLLARGMVPFTPKKTTFYYISRDDKSFVPDLMTLFKMLKQGKIRVPIKAVYELDDIQEAHWSWSKGTDMGSLLVKLSDESVI